MMGSSLEQLQAIRRSSVRRLKTANLEQFIHQLILLRAAAEHELEWRKREADGKVVRLRTKRKPAPACNVVAFKPAG